VGIYVDTHYGSDMQTHCAAVASTTDQEWWRKRYASCRMSAIVGFLVILHYARCVQIFDAFIIISSFTIDIIFLGGVSGEEGQKAAAVLVILLLWRIARVVDGMLNCRSGECIPMIAQRDRGFSLSYLFRENFIARGYCVFCPWYRLQVACRRHQFK